MDGVLTSQDAHGVATVTLNRPERRNAFDDAFIGQLDRAFAKLARASTEGREGFAAFLEKRNPVFRS
jgi:enoyl-CoA hydratase/carnithine racemase